MKRTALLFSLFLILICNSIANAGLRIMESIVMHSRILKHDVHFSVCLPKNYYGVKQSFPVVYLLHGLGDDETSWLEYGQITQFADKAVESGETVPMIFVMPEAFRTYYVNDYKGSFLYQDMFVKEMVPHIDSLFRTISDKQQRALMGYSMGGFGALILHLKHTDIFGTAVPLSISVRTDEQYMTEDASGWDDQWGRLFGEPGFKGADRITDYYKKNSPFHVLSKMTAAEMKNLNIYIDNGDKEQTLCRSNEELHILMRKMKFPHEYRVREGGHSFEYWVSALPNALRFISDAFESKPYRGDLIFKTEIAPLPDKQFVQMTIDNEQVFAYLPAEYENTDRLYPVLYFSGNITPEQCKSIAAFVNRGIEKNEIGPMLVVFLNVNSTILLPTTLPALEEKLRIRKGYRFRALAGYQDTGPYVLSAVTNMEQQFSSCILVYAYVDKQNVVGLLQAMKPGALEHTPVFILVPDKGRFYEGNGNLHMILRDKDLKHEYRVTEGEGGLDWMIGGLEEMIKFVAINFHR